MNQIEIYKGKDNQTQVQVKFEDETVWLNIEQMSLLFEKSRATINEHILNIFKQKELEKEQVMRKIGNSDFSTKPTNIYNLDVIISVGYRVNSKRGTQFRQWATQRLKEYLVQGYSVNEKRLKQVAQNLHALEQTVKQIQQTGSSDGLQLNEAKGLLDILGNYTRSLVLLSRYDSDSLGTEKLNAHITYEIKHDEARKAITELRNVLMKKKEASELFGNEKDESFKGILGNIVQTFGGEYLYASIEE